MQIMTVAKLVLELSLTCVGMETFLVLFLERSCEEYHLDAIALELHGGGHWPFFVL